MTDTTVADRPPVALVTGGSRGIGAAVAIALAEAGCDIIINYRTSSEDAEKVAQSVRERGREATTIAADVSDETAVVSMFREIRSKFGRLDVAVLNSGITADGHFATMSARKWDSVISTNLTGTFLTARETTKLMFSTGGAIVMISSTSGVAGRSGQGNYAASKGGIIAMAKSLAAEVAGRGIRVNVVAPGFIETDMVRTVPKAMREVARTAIPLQRFGTAAEVAQAVVFLGMPTSSYITGKVLTVDGGMIAA